MIAQHAKAPSYEEHNRGQRGPQSPVRQEDRQDYALHGHRVYTRDQLQQAESLAGDLKLAD